LIGDFAMDSGCTWFRLHQMLG